MAEQLFATDSYETRIQDEVERRIQALRREPQRLLERFDQNGDGVIDAREWEIIRSVVAREVVSELHVRRHRKETVPDPSKPAVRSPLNEKQDPNTEHRTPNTEQNVPEPPPHLRLSPSARDDSQREVLRGRYEILSELGRGAQAHTYLAYDHQTEEYVAVKELDFEIVDDWKVVELFEREADVLRRLDHRGIPSFVDSFHLQEDGITRVFLIQEYVEGDNLLVRLARGELFNEERVRAMAGQALEILEYLHGFEPAILHRDIKPSNLIERPDGSIAIVDFGAVQTAALDTDELGSTVVGTTGYMPPEQLMGRAVPSTDLYGLGATMIHLLTRRHPSDLPTERMTYRWHEFTNASEPLRSFVDRLTEPVVEDRFQDCIQAGVALRNLTLGGETPSTLPVLPEKLPETTPRKAPSRDLVPSRDGRFLPSVKGRPRGSFISMHRVPGTLELRVPSRPLKGWVYGLVMIVPVIALILFFLIAEGFTAATVFAASVGGAVFLIGFWGQTCKGYFQETDAKFDAKGMDTTFTLFGKEKRLRRRLAHLKDPRVFSRNKSRECNVEISTASGTVTLASNVSREEANWVAGVIQAFLIEMKDS